MFWYGWKEYLVLRTVPKGALEVTATARMWSWNFTYANGATSPKLYVPVGKPVRVNLVATDVIHGFLPAGFPGQARRGAGHVQLCLVRGK